MPIGTTRRWKGTCSFKYRVTSTTQSSENLIFSIAHWLLIIAIRRGILVNINSLDDLLSQTQRHIMAKPEFLNDPVLLAFGPRGLLISPIQLEYSAKRLVR
jgi:hypothetical protein